MAGDKSIGSGAAIGIVIAVVLVAIVAGLVFINRPKPDPIADAVHRDRGTTATPNIPNAPMKGAPPKAGSSDYSKPGQ